MFYEPSQKTGQSGISQRGISISLQTFNFNFGKLFLLNVINYCYILFNLHS